MLHARVQYNLLRSVSDRAVMLRQQASRLISSCLTTRAAQLSDSAPDCQQPCVAWYPKPAGKDLSEPGGRTWVATRRLGTIVLRCAGKLGM